MHRTTTSFVLLALLALVGGGFALGRWSSSVSVTNSKATDAGHDDEHGHDHGGHDHGGGDANQLPLSEQARVNLNLVVKEVQLADYWRTVTIPAVVGELPGHSERRITTAVHGVVTMVYVSPGQTVRPGAPLFDIQTTGDVLAGSQAALLKTLQDLELAQIELKRLEPLVASGALQGTRTIEKRYEVQRLESARQIQMQELLVRGLSGPQIQSIIETKVLLREFTVRVPGVVVDATSAKGKGKRPAVMPAAYAKETGDTITDESARLYSIESIEVFPGKLVQPGEEMCDLAVHDELRLEGMAFPRDSELIAKALEEQRPVAARFESGAGQPVIREGLTIQFADNVVDPVTRLFKFYLPFRNEVARDTPGPDGVQYRSWRFKPGQRLQLSVPAEKWDAQIVVPTEAVVREGAEAYIFRANGRLFERAPVSVLHEDANTTVLANDGSVFEGEKIAWNQAYQLNLALRKAQGAGVDLHAGHNH